MSNIKHNHYLEKAKKVLKELKKCFNDPDCTRGRRLDATVLTLVVASIILTCYSTVADLSPAGQRKLQLLETTVLVVFAIEYGMRVWAAPIKRAYVLSFFGVVDFLAILPLFIGLATDLQALRIFRLMRIFSLLKLFRHRRAMEDLTEAFSQMREELMVFAVVTSFMLFVSSLAIFHFENPVQPEIFSNLFDSLWWSVVTMTTVGYGDMTPVTVGGRLFAMVLLIMGLGIVAIPTGLIASALSNVRRGRVSQADNDTDSGTADDAKSVARDPAEQNFTEPP